MARQVQKDKANVVELNAEIARAKALQKAIDDAATAVKERKKAALKIDVNEMTKKEIREAFDPYYYDEPDTTESHDVFKIIGWCAAVAIVIASAVVLWG